MRSLPDILKQAAFREMGDAVCIPDIDLSPPPEPEPPEPEEIAPEPLTPPTREEMAVLFADELEAARCEAAERAYADAIHQKRGELREALDRVDALLIELQEQQDQYMEQYARELKYLAVDIAEKVMLQKLAEDDLALAPLVLKTVSSVKHSRWLTVDVSERLVGLVGYLNEELKKPEYRGTAEVAPTASPDDTCRVNTDEGTLVATLSVQTKHLREAFADTDAGTGETRNEAP